MRLNTAIFLFDDVEVLDFAGPFEVFAVTDELAQQTLFNTYTVAELAGVVRARNGLRVVPNHTFESAPVPDIIVIPGGFGTRPLLNRPLVIEWVRRQSRQAQYTVSVCTGALLLAKAGLLDGLQVTTHHLRLDLLRELAPAATVHADRRFLDNGNILTSAGISAGIDVSLHLVARLCGAETAEKTAAHMEYAWSNDGGVRTTLSPRPAP
jgi:transcriptional regulator GlxA family with amidase domain